MGEIWLPEKLQFLLTKRARYKVAYGGRGGAKSQSFARSLLIHGAQRKHRILCTRELQASIKDSVHKLLGDQIEKLGMSSRYRVTQTQILGANGTEFIFSGLRYNVDSIKSIEGVTICWVEEAQSVSEESWEVLIPTIREPGSEIWASWNPDQESDPVRQRFIVHPPPDSIVVEIGWRDNPFFPDILRQEKDYLYAADPEAAAHVWGGALWKKTNAQVLRGRYRVEHFEPDPKWDGPYYGIDWGFGVTPTVMVKLWVNSKSVSPPDMELYVEHEAYGREIDIIDTPALFDAVPGAREHTARADSARPETISHMRQHGYPRIIACQKGPGSVEDGVEFLRSFKAIVIHPRCVLAAEQARLWSYKTDRLTGDVLPELIDKHDDVWDACRYALEPAIRSILKRPPAGRQAGEPPEKWQRTRRKSSRPDWRTV